MAFSTQRLKIHYEILFIYSTHTAAINMMNINRFRFTHFAWYKFSRIVSEFVMIYFCVFLHFKLRDQPSHQPLPYSAFKARRFRGVFHLPKFLPIHLRAKIITPISENPAIKSQKLIISNCVMISSKLKFQVMPNQ